MTAWIENHGANVVGVLFLVVLWMAAVLFVTGMAIYGITSALNSAHLNLSQLRERREKERRQRMESAERMLRQL